MIILTYPCVALTPVVDLDTQIRELMTSRGLVELGQGASIMDRDIEFGFEIDDTSEAAVLESNQRQWAIIDALGFRAALNRISKAIVLRFEADEVYDVKIEDWREVVGWDYSIKG